MSLICMAVYDLEGSGRTELTEKCFQSLLNTVDFRRHRICVIDNASCHASQQLIMEFGSMIDEIQYGNFQLVANKENLGTAKAINQGLVHRKSGEHAIKCDNDVVFNSPNWIEELEDAIRREPKIGVLGLKRKDLGESANNPDSHFKSTLIELPHKGGERWVTFEKVVHGVMGTCTMYNSALLDKIGYLYQPTIYGWDDGLVTTRSTIAGFINGFLPHIDIDHIDPGATFYQKWKENHAAQTASEAWKLNQAYLDGTRPVYEEA